MNSPLLLALFVTPAMLWVAVLLLPWQPWRTRERLEVATAAGPIPPQVTAIVPARNEAAVIARSLHALRAQRGLARIIVVDDESSDGTGAIAGSIEGVDVLRGEPLPADWTGKLWALEQGSRRARSPWLLFLDADIVLEPGVLDAMLDIARRDRRQLVSVMAWLRMRGRWERLLMPAFVYFFKLLYPFALARRDSSRVAAAAGGCMLLERTALESAGGIAAVRNAIIDDCALARSLKRSGARIWIGLSREVRSTRRYPDWASVRDMVARTAFTQLGYSTSALLGCTLALALAFWVPLIALASGQTPGSAAGAIALACMLFSYLPLLRYYRVPSRYALTLPLAASLLLVMTWRSAVGCWRGTRARWKDRSYDAAHRGSAR